MTDYEKWFDDALQTEGVGLSAAGATRRAALGRALQRTVVVRRRRRAAARWGAGAGAGAVALAAALWWPVGRGGGVDPAPRPPQVAVVGPALVELIHDDPAILARYRSAPPLPADALVDDDELLALLESANRPAGLVRTADRLITTDLVVDAMGE